MHPKYERVLRELRKAGYSNVTLIENKPNSRTKPHFHLRELKIVILRGSLKMNVDGTIENYKYGDIIKIRKRATHSGIAGKKGVDVAEGFKG